MSKLLPNFSAHVTADCDTVFLRAALQYVSMSGVVSAYNLPDKGDASRLSTQSDTPGGSTDHFTLRRVLRLTHQAQYRTGAKSDVYRCLVITLPPISQAAEYCDERVCLSVCVCLSAIISSELHVRSSPTFLCMLPMAGGSVRSMTGL